MLSGCIPSSIPLATKERIDNGKEPFDDGNSLKANGTNQLSAHILCWLLKSYLRILDFSLSVSTVKFYISCFRSCKILSSYDFLNSFELDLHKKSPIPVRLVPCCHTSKQYLKGIVTSNLRHTYGLYVLSKCSWTKATMLLNYCFPSCTVNQMVDIVIQKVL